jgi:hypothetical protein
MNCSSHEENSIERKKELEVNGNFPSNISGVMDYFVLFFTI